MNLPNRPTDARSSLVVHETGRPPAPVLRYVDQVVGSPTAIEFRFSQSVLTAFDVDVLHVPDPKLDQLLGTRGAGDFQRLLATLALARNLRRHRIALVRTLHSVGSRRRRSWALHMARRVLDRVTTKFVVLDESVRSPDAVRTTVIAHPHFRDRFVGYPRAEIVPGRLLCVSADELPAEAQHLLPLPRATNTDNLTVRLAGTAPRQLEEYVRSVVAQHATTATVRLERLSDGALVQEILSAELVVLPRVQTMSEVQLVYFALSLDRPVVVTPSEAMTRLAAQVGPGWVHVTDGPITGRVIDEAMVAVRSAERSDRPALDDRDLATTHAAYESVFHVAAAAIRDR